MAGWQQAHHKHFAEWCFAAETRGNYNPNMIDQQFIKRTTGLRAILLLKWIAATPVVLLPVWWVPRTGVAYADLPF